jgi:hypothetical protein
MVCLERERNLQGEESDTGSGEETSSLGSASSGTGELGDGGGSGGSSAVAGGSGSTADRAVDGGALGGGLRGRGSRSNSDGGSSRGLRGGAGGSGHLRDSDLNTGGLAGLLNGSDGSLLLLGGAGLLDARNHGSEEGLGLLAMALEVLKGLAAILAKGLEEAAQSARGDVVELGRGNSGQSKGGGNSEGLHVDWLLVVRLERVGEFRKKRVVTGAGKTTVDRCLLEYGRWVGVCDLKYWIGPVGRNR